MGVVFHQVEDRGEYWMVHNTTTFSDGAVEPGVNILKKDTLEWRAVEYGIDPTDLDTLLDIAMVEPYLTPEEQAEGVFLLDAATTQQAREAHIARCAKAKLRLKLATRTKDPEPQVRSFLSGKLGVPEVRANNLDFIRVGSYLDPEVMEIKRKVVQNSVRVYRENKSQVKRTRLEKIRDDLEMKVAKNG